MNKTNRLTFCVIIGLFCGALLFSNPVLSITSSSSSVSTSSSESDYKKARRYERKESFKSAIKWYKKAANKSHPRAQYRLGILYYKQKNYKKAKYWLKKRSNAGEADAQYHYANILRFGLGTKQQTSNARKWYTKAAKQGHKHAQYELAIMFQKGIGAKKSTKTAKKWLKKAAKQNHKLAKKELKKYSKSSRSTTKSAQSKSKKLTFVQKQTKLAKSGNVKAQYRLAKAYKNGKKAPKNLRKAVKWYSKAAVNGHTESQFELANFHYYGTGFLDKNIEKAKKWYRKAANDNHSKAGKQLDKIAKLDLKNRQSKQFDSMIDSALLGDSEQQYELGMRYLLGFKTTPDDKQAFYWLNLAATQAHPRAMYQVANQYISGKVVEKDIYKAIHYYSQAAQKDIPAANTALLIYAENGFENIVKAESGDQVAQYQLANAYLNKSSLEDQKIGLEWLVKSSDQAHSPALLQLAAIYEDGTLTVKSYEKAFKAYQTAAKHNNATAQYELGRMYQAGIGTKVNPQLAYRWFEKAASQGLKEAQQALQFSGL